MSASGPEAGKESLLKIVICQRHQLLSIAKGILRCPFLAEDVVQDAALKVTRMDFDQRIQCPLQFAKSMVRNLAIDQVRRRRLESDYLMPETGGENHVFFGADPCSRLEAWEAIGAVFSALDELPEKTQRAFERVRIEGIPQKKSCRRDGRIANVRSLYGLGCPSALPRAAAKRCDSESGFKPIGCARKPV